MMAAPTVSVIIPTYNRAQLIRPAIDSVLAQSYRDFEVVVVDDASTDDTESVVGAYGDRVRYLRTRHGGVAHARNAGMREARGRYLTFLDSDDLLYPWALELEVALLDGYPDMAMACAELTGFDDRGWSERYHLRNYHRSSFRDPALTWERIYGSSRPIAEACAVPAALLRDDPAVRERRVYAGGIFDTYLTRLVVCQNTAMLRRSVIAEIGPRREHVYNYEEYDYLLRLARGHGIVFADVPTYRLRYHASQISSEAGSGGLLVWLRKQRALLGVFRRHALADPDYYARHRERLDRHFAELYRGLALPMLMMRDGSRARYARLCLARCRQYGDPQRILHAASFAPGPLRRLAVRLIEGLRAGGVAALVRRALRRLSRISGSRAEAAKIG